MISIITRLYPQFNLIDLSGPLEALEIATNMVPGSYQVTTERLLAVASMPYSSTRIAAPPIRNRTPRRAMRFS
jgi:hypothetical protein